MKLQFNIDINQLSLEQKIELVKAIFASDKGIEKKVASALNTTDDISEELIERIIEDDFNRYDEVFKALA